MNSVKFDKVVEGCIDKIKSVLQKKSQEYSSDDDKLHNFNKAKDLMRCKTKEFALLGMLNKHLVSVIDMIEKYEKTGKLPNSYLLDEKIGDSINYFILLKACFYDDMIRKEAEKENLCEKCLKVVDCDMVKAVSRSGKVTICEDYEDLSKSLYKNPRKQLVVNAMKKRLQTILDYCGYWNRKAYLKFQEVFVKEQDKEDSVADDDFVNKIIELLDKTVIHEACINVVEERKKLIKELEKEAHSTYCAEGKR